MTDRIIPPALTAVRLRELLSYDPEIGLFRWIVGKRRGFIAGCQTVSGYWQIAVDGRSYRAHRLAWFYVHGEWPANILDHRGGDRLKNEFSNIRPAAGWQNNGNQKRNVRNTSGYKGVYKNGKWSTWIARISAQKERRFLRCYDSPKDAAKAYDLAAVELFGEFARTNRMLGLLD